MIEWPHRRPPENPHQPMVPVRCTTYAPWIRGRVYKLGATWHLEVINTRTGVVLDRDNTGAWAPMRDEVDRVVGVARWAAFYGLARRSVTR